MKLLTVYSRQGCHLCEDMLEALAAFSNELGYTFEVYDVDENKSLFDQYNTLVPIVFYNDVEVMRYFFELETLKQVLKTSGID